GRVHYVNSMYPETPWTAEFRIESTERGLDFVQDSEAVKDGENYSFSKGRFSVERDTDGYARIVNVDSESVHESGFFLKKS
ncbi:MAG: hypothetical protein K2F63_04720, partial [Muribaculaceae bacterium]|nr:hypothetical protein [Muribaculaceae bacterium]